MPAYWFMYNMYALARNAWKTVDRDKRPEKLQLLETNYLAPDTVNDMFDALEMLEELTGKHVMRQEQPGIAFTDEQFKDKGKELILYDDIRIQNLELDEHGFENGNRKCLLLKVPRAWQAYRDSILIYALDVILEYVHNHPEYSFQNLSEELVNAGNREKVINIGGQLIRKSQIETLKQQITSYEVISWDDVHQFYHIQAHNYSADKFQHALASLKELLHPELPDKQFISGLLKEYYRLRQNSMKAMEDSRLRDYSNPFRQMVYENMDEMYAVLGKPDNNSFVKMQKQELARVKEKIDLLISSWELP